MNRKEFIEKHCVQTDTEILLETGIDSLWQWIEQQINQAKIDENKHWENICFEQEKLSIKKNDFIERIKYLEV